MKRTEKEDEYEKEILDAEFQEAIDEYEFFKKVTEVRFQESKDRYDYIKIQET